MRVLFVISAIFVCAQALPTEFGQRADNATADFNAARMSGIMGFATHQSGTKGGQGGQVWTVWDAWALKDAISGNSARIINVHGKIDLGVLFSKSPGVVLDVGSSKTIQGGDKNAEITGGGLRIKQNKQVIIKDIKFTNAISYANGEKPNGSGGIQSMVKGEFTEVDAILLEEATFVWIDHNEFSDDPWNANTTPKDQMRHDGLVDIKRASSYVTVSNNIFRNHNKNCLVGHSDSNSSQDKGKLRITFAYNWFQGTTQRNPRVRYGEVHVLNNLYTDIGQYGIGAGAGAKILAERNAFVNTKRAWGFPDGTPNPMGNLLAVNNHLVNSGFDSGIPNDIKFDVNNYYKYTPIGSTNVEAHVRKNAGPWK